MNLTRWTLIKGSQIKDEFEGFDDEMIFELIDGTFWVQSTYKYNYHYGYRPKVFVYKKSTEVPVRYTVEQENETVTVYSCKIDLPLDKIAEWLTPHEFTIRKIYKKPITITKLSQIEIWGSVEAALFADKTAKHIKVREINESMMS